MALVSRDILIARSLVRVSLGGLICPALLALSTILLRAQDLEPRAYSASPVGTSFAGIGFARSSGDISFDPSIPITNAKATLYSPAVGLGHTFGVFGRLAQLTAALPYAWGNASGDVGNQQQGLYRSGLADVRTRFSVNLWGDPAMSVEEFSKHPRRKLNCRDQPVDDVSLGAV